MFKFLVPPPARPTAPKPGQPQPSMFDTSLPGMPTDASGLYPGTLYSSMLPPGMSQPVAEPQQLRLKDFLPLMKPGSFGPKAPLNAATTSAPGGGMSAQLGSLPGSISASPVHFTQIGGSLPASPHRQMHSTAVPEVNYQSEAANFSIPQSLASTFGSLPASQLPGSSAGYCPSASNSSEAYARDANMAGYYNNVSIAGQFIPHSSHVANAASSTGSAGTSSGFVSPASSQSNQVGYGSSMNGYSSSSQTAGAMQSSTVNSTVGQVGMLPMSRNDSHNETSASTYIQPQLSQSYLPHLPSDSANNEFAQGRMPVAMQSYYPANSGVPPNDPRQSWNQSYSGGSQMNQTEGVVATAGASGYTGGQNTGAVSSTRVLPSVAAPSQQYGANNFPHQQIVSRMQPPQHSSAPGSIPSFSQTPTQSTPQNSMQFYPVGYVPADSRTPMGFGTNEVRPAGMQHDAGRQVYQMNNQIQPGSSAPDPRMLHQSTGSGTHSVTDVPQSSYSNASQQFNNGNRLPGQFPQYQHMPTAISNQQPARFPNAAPVNTANFASEQRPSGYPVNTAERQGYVPQPSNSNQPAQHYAAPNQYQNQTGPGYTDGMSQIRYPSQSLQQNVQVPYPMQGTHSGTANMQNSGYTAPVSTAQSTGQMSGRFAAENQQQLSYSGPSTQYMTMPGAQQSQHGFQMGSQQQYGYQTGGSQQFVTSQQGYPSSQQGFNHTSANQAAENYGQTYAGQNFQTQSHQHGGASIRQSTPAAAYPPPASSAVDIPPPSLPSPLQPSRPAAGSSNSIKNLDSLKDLDVSTTASTAAAASPAPSSVESPATNERNADNPSRDGSSAPQSLSTKERREEEVRRTLQRSRSVRDPYADADVLTRFVTEVEKFQKLVDALVKPTLGGYLPLDKEWKVGGYISMYVC